MKDHQERRREGRREENHELISLAASFMIAFIFVERERTHNS